MSIKQTRYVDIASAVIGASTAPMRKLTARIFSTNPKIPAGKFSNLLLVKLMRFWGADSSRSAICPPIFLVM